MKEIPRRTPNREIKTNFPTIIEISASDTEKRQLINEGIVVNAMIEASNVSAGTSLKVDGQEYKLVVLQRQEFIGEGSIGIHAEQLEPKPRREMYFSGYGVLEAGREVAVNNGLEYMRLEGKLTREQFMSSPARIIQTPQGPKLQVAGIGDLIEPFDIPPGEKHGSKGINCGFYAIKADQLP